MLTLKTMGKMVSKLVMTYEHRFMTSFTQSRQLLSRTRPRNVKKKSVFVTFALMILTACLGGLEGMYVEGWTFVEGF